MDIDLKVLQEKFSHLLHRSGALHTHAIASPVRDWKIVLACTAGGVLCAVLFAGFVYLDARTAVTVQDGGEVASVRAKIDEAEIHKVLSAFDRRSVIHGQVRAGGGGISDPSR